MPELINNNWVTTTAGINPDLYAKLQAAALAGALNGGQVGNIENAALNGIINAPGFGYDPTILQGIAGATKAGADVTNANDAIGPVLPDGSPNPNFDPMKWNPNAGGGGAAPTLPDLNDPNFAKEYVKGTDPTLTGQIEQLSFDTLPHGPGLTGALANALGLVTPFATGPLSALTSLPRAAVAGGLGALRGGLTGGGEGALLGGLLGGGGALAAQGLSGLFGGSGSPSDLISGGTGVNELTDVGGTGDILTTGGTNLFPDFAPDAFSAAGLGGLTDFGQINPANFSLPGGLGAFDIGTSPAGGAFGPSAGPDGAVTVAPVTVNPPGASGGPDLGGIINAPGAFLNPADLSHPPDQPVTNNNGDNTAGKFIDQIIKVLTGGPGAGGIGGPVTSQPPADTGIPANTGPGAGGPSGPSGLPGGPTPGLPSATTGVGGAPKSPSLITVGGSQGGGGLGPAGPGVNVRSSLAPDIYPWTTGG